MLSTQPQHITEIRGEIFIWMIAWMRRSSLGDKFSHAYHHSYLKDSLAQQEGIHYTFYISMVSTVDSMHTWERALEDSFIATYLSSGGTIDEEATREEGGEDFFLFVKFLEGKQHVGGEDCNVPNFSLKLKWNIIVAHFILFK